MRRFSRGGLMLACAVAAACFVQATRAEDAPKPVAGDKASAVPKPDAKPAPPTAPKKADPTDVPAPRDPSWMKRHEGFVEIAKKGDADVLFIGDSITDGWRGNGKDVWASYYAPIKAINFGIGGDRTQHVLWRITNGELDGIKPKAIVLMIGTNNSGANTSEEIAAGVKKIVETFRAKLPESKILLLAIFPRGGGAGDAARKKNEGANAIIAKLDDGKMIKYLDIGKTFMAEDGTLPPDIMPDKLHLTAKGYQLWADAINPTLGELLGAKIEKHEAPVAEKKPADKPTLKPAPAEKPAEKPAGGM